MFSLGATRGLCLKVNLSHGYRDPSFFMSTELWGWNICHSACVLKCFSCCPCFSSINKLDEVSAVWWKIVVWVKVNIAPLKRQVSGGNNVIGLLISLFSTPVCHCVIPHCYDNRQKSNLGFSSCVWITASFVPFGLSATRTRVKRT